MNQMQLDQGRTDQNHLSKNVSTCWAGSESLACDKSSLAARCFQWPAESPGMTSRQNAQHALTLIQCKSPSVLQPVRSRSCEKGTPL